jgi:hypothetical protein
LSYQPPGWHPDPWGEGGERWWDGQGWTEHIRGGAAQVAPAPAYAGPTGPAAPTGGRRRGPLIALIVGAVLFAVMALALIGFLVAGAGGDKTFDEPRFNISFDYPSGFTRRDVPEGNSDEKISLAIDNNNGIAVSKYEQETRVTEANIGFAQSLLDGVVRQLSSDPSPEAKRVTIAGLPGFEYEFPIKTLPGVRSRSIFLFQGRDEYQINCQFQSDERQRVMEACDQALDTLEVTGPGR